MDQYWNSYSYCGGDPINYIDPYGLSSVEKGSELEFQEDDGADYVWYIEIYLYYYDEPPPEQQSEYRRIPGVRTIEVNGTRPATDPVQKFSNDYNAMQSQGPGGYAYNPFADPSMQQAYSYYNEQREKAIQLANALMPFIQRMQMAQLNTYKTAGNNNVGPDMSSAVSEAKGFGAANSGMVVGGTLGMSGKVLAKQAGVLIQHFGTAADHGPAHAHVTGQGPNTRIGPLGHPLKGDQPLSSTQRAVVQRNLATIRRALNKLGRAFKAIDKALGRIPMIMIISTPQIEQMIKDIEMQNTVY